MTMPYRSLAAVAAVLAVTSVVGANVRPSPASHVIHCGPAPLTERPGIQWEFSQPHVALLETAFAEAARAKRSVATLRINNPR